MRTFLFSWKPKQWPWIELPDSIAQVESRGYFDDRWSCGNRRDIVVGDRFFLIRLGIEQARGLIGSGFVTEPETRPAMRPSEPFQSSAAFDGPHWNDGRAAAGEMAIYVNVRFDALSNDPVIPIEELDQPPFHEVHWPTQSSGILIPPDIAAAVEQLWATRVSLDALWLPEELAAWHVYIEGARRQIVVNAYERNPDARQKCLERHGYACSCCGILLSERYGQIAQDFIHVHHLVPISEIGHSYVIDPVNDLVPVCPTCHAIIHRRKPPHPPLSIDEVKALLAANRQITV